MTTTDDTTLMKKRSRRMARQPDAEPIQPATAAPPRPPQTKAEQVLALLRRPDGATLDELVEMTSWLPHTTRAHLTGLRKKGHTLASDKTGGVRRYRIAVLRDAGAGQ